MLGSKPSGIFRIIALGDIVGRAGRRALREKGAALKSELNADVLIVNGENASGGAGLSKETGAELRRIGADIITLGDHTWDRKDIKDFLADSQNYCIRPGNYPYGAPGAGHLVWTNGEIRLGVANFLGRVFKNMMLDCPFKLAKNLLANQLKDCNVIVCDFHAEATSEKVAFGNFVDGQVSLVFGTHTHVQTSDNRILKNGPAYITDLGMCGPLESVIGMRTDIAIERFVTGLPVSYDVMTKGPAVLSGVVCDVDTKTKKAVAIERLSYILEG